MEIEESKKVDIDIEGHKWKIEKQVLMLLGVLVLIFLSFMLGIYIKNHYFNPNIFKYGKMTVYKSRMEGINVDFYNIPVEMSGGAKNILTFRSDPRALENLSMNVSNELLKGITHVWIVYSPDLTSDAVIAAGEMGRFTNVIGLRTDFALTKDGEKYNFKELNCSEASQSIRVIEMRLGNSTGVYSEGYCIVAEGKDYPEMIMASDKLAIEWLKEIIA